MRAWTLTIGLTTALAALLVVWPSTGAAVPVLSHMTELHVTEVIPLLEQHQAAVILVPRQGEEVVPVLIDEGAGQALASVLQGAPGGSQMLAETIAGMGGKVVRVELSSVDGVRVHSRVIVERGRRRMTIEGDAGSTIGLALTAGVPLVASPEVIRVLGLTREQVRAIAHSPEPPHPAEHGHPSTPGASMPMPGISL